MRLALAFLLLLLSLPLPAQYGPPAKDLDEATFFVREIQRQLEPAMNEARDRAMVFGVVARAHNKLIGKEPATEISDAIQLIDDLLYRRQRAGKEFSRENLRTLESVRKELELAQPPAIGALRERLHHEFVHNLERQVLKDMGALERLQAEWDGFSIRVMKPVHREGMAGVVSTAAGAPQPD